MVPRSRMPLLESQGRMGDGNREGKAKGSRGPLSTAIPHHSSDRRQFYPGDLLQEDRGGITRQN